MENSNNIQSDELNFHDILSIILRWKWVFLGVWGFVIILALIYIFSAKPIYESKAEIYIGEYPVFAKSKKSIVAIPTKQVDFLTKLIEQPYVLVDRLKSQDGITAKWDSNKPELIEMSVLADSPEDALDRINKLLNSILDEHAITVNEIKKNLDSQRIILEKSKEHISQEIRVLNDNIKKNSSLENTQLAIEKLHLLMQQNRSELITSSLMMYASLVRETSIVVQPKLEMNPIKPNKKLVTLGAVVFGFVLGILIVFIITFSKNQRER